MHVVAALPREIIDIFFFHTLQVEVTDNFLCKTLLTVAFSEDARKTVLTLKR